MVLTTQLHVQTLPASLQQPAHPPTPPTVTRQLGSLVRVGETVLIPPPQGQSPRPTRMFCSTRGQPLSSNSASCIKLGPGKGPLYAPWPCPSLSQWAELAQPGSSSSSSKESRTQRHSPESSCDPYPVSTVYSAAMGRAMGWTDLLHLLDLSLRGPAME